MRTLKGYEALEVADEYQISLYDVYYKNELTVEEAQQFIESKRDPQSFVLENWPDTDEEAERIVLSKFQQALKDHKIASARIADLKTLPGGMPLHQQAAELAADRLVGKHQLLLGEMHRDGAFYGIPQTTYFTDDFLDHLRRLVCDECAHLNLEEPFHDSCLRSLLEFFSTNDFSLEEITELRQHTQRNGKLTSMIRPGIGLLSKTVAETKSRWNSVFKPMFAKDTDDSSDAPNTESSPSIDIAEQHDEPTAPVAEVPAPVVKEGPAAVEISATGYQQQPETVDLPPRQQVTKEEIIEYLRQVEIVDESGTVSRLEQERRELAEQIMAKEREIEKARKDRAYWEKQFHEMERDMDTMIEALQIAKRRQHSERVIDATYENKSSNDDDGRYPY